MARFRDKSIQLLIATDVAARGIDVTGITHVINYELPDDLEVYTHRSGRTGRAGRSGVCVSLLTNREVYRLKQIERMVNNRFHKMDIPSGKDVCRKQFFHFIDKMVAADISHGEYETYLPVLREKFANVEKEEILQRVAALEFDRFLQYYENAADLNVREEKRTERTPISRDRGDRGDVAIEAKEVKGAETEANRVPGPLVAVVPVAVEAYRGFLLTSEQKMVFIKPVSCSISWI